MADWETVNAFGSDSGQIMTARHLNRVTQNLHWINGAMRYGASPFRSVNMRVYAESWATIWQGWYCHYNKQIVGVYSIYRTSNGVRVDNVEYNGNRNPLAYPAGGGGGGGDVAYLFNAGVNSQIRFQIYDDTSTWQTLTTVSSGVEATAQTFTVDPTSVATLTVGTFYRVRVQGYNGLFGIERIHGELSASYTYPALPATTDGTVLSVANWNTFRTALLYCKEILDAPRSPTSGTGGADGSSMPGKRGRNTETSYATTIWVGRIRHRSNTLQYRIGVRALSSGHSTDTSKGVVSLYYNNVLVAGTNSERPTSPDAATDASFATEFGTGAEVRYLSGSGDNSDTNTLRYVAGEWDLTAQGLTFGNWYDIELRTANNDGTDPEYAAYLDYVMEVEGEPTAALTAATWSHADYVRGDTGGSPRTITQWKNDLTNTLKPAIDQHVQLLCPDIATDSAWSVGTGYDRPNVPCFLRQRPILRYACTAGITLYWGDPRNPSNQSLSTTTDGSLALDELDGLNVGTQYWLSPMTAVKYAMEVWQ